MTRDSLLGKLIDTILLHDFVWKKDDAGIEIKKGKGYSTYHSFCSPSELDKYRRLFIYCFHSNVPSLMVDIQKKKGKPIIRHDEMIDNAAAFFHRIGIDFGPLRKYCESDQEYEDLMLHAVVDYLIPTAFAEAVTIKDFASDEQSDFDDISDQYEEALKQIKRMLLRFRSSKMIRSIGDDILEIGDNRYLSRDYNYAVRLPLDYFSFTRFSPSYFRLPLRTAELRDQYKKQLEQEALKPDFDRLVRGFYEYPFHTSDEEDWISNMTFTEDDPSEILFPLSDTVITGHDPTGKSFYYLTHLDGESIKKEYPSVSSHSELEAAILERSKEDQALYRNDLLKEYYINTAEYINEVLSRLMKIDLTELTIGAPDDELACRNALNAFAIDPDDVFPLILEQRQDVLWFTYHLLKRALYEFSLNLITWGDKLGTDVRQYLVDSSLLTKHIQCIDSFLESEPFKSIAEDQVKNIGNDGNAPEPAKTADEVDRTLAEREAYESRVFSHLFADLRSGLENYLSSLRGQNQPVA